MEQLAALREDITSRWDKLGFLEGLKGHLRENIAQLYENQANQLLKESTNTSSSGSFETVVFPIVRRVFSKLLANDIVSVQALNLPIGKLYFFVPKISTGQAGWSTQGGAPDKTDPTWSSTNLYDAYYENADNPNDSLYDRSRGKVENWNIAYDGSAFVVQAWDTGARTMSSGTIALLTGCSRSLLLKYSGFNLSGSCDPNRAGVLVGPDGQSMDTEEFLASLTITSSVAAACCEVDSNGVVAAGTTTYVGGAGKYIPFRLVTQKYGKGIVEYNSNCPCDASGDIYVELDMSCPACVACPSVDGYVGSFVTSAFINSLSFNYRTYQDLEFATEISEVTFTLDSVTVSVTERKLRANWSPELAQDVSAFHNIDAEAELTAILSEEIAAEIDREILKDLRTGAAWMLRWDYNGWKRFKAGQAPYTQKDWNQTLVTAINQISAQIHKATLRGGANFIVVSAEISAIFDDLEYFHVSNAAPEQDQYNMGIEKIGSLSGRYTVYRDPYFPSNMILIGHKGTSLLDTGYIYAPYVPIQLTPTMYNPFNFTPIKGIMTRYAKKMVNNRFYGKIMVDGVRTWGVRELR